MSYDKEFLQNIILNSLSIAQVCRELGLRPSGGNYKKIKILIKNFDIDISHFTGQGWNKNNKFNLLRQKYTLEDILLNKVTYSSTTRLKQRLISEGYKENKCEKCNLSEWMNKQIPLELNHINGDNLDNRLENLEILCCNCHAQTDNWRGRNTNKSSKLNVALDNYNNYKDSVLIKEEEVKKEKIIKEKPSCARCGNKCLKNTYKYCSQECYKEDIKEFKKVPKVPELLEAFKIYKNFLQVGKFFNVSDNAVRKWCKNYGILEIVSKKSLIFEL